jgi:hypothetical protein
MLEYLNFNVDREYIFKSKIVKKSLHGISNHNGVSVLTLPHQKNCQKYDVPTTKHLMDIHSQIDHILIGSRRQKVYFRSSLPGELTVIQPLSGAGKGGERLGVSKRKK